MTYTLFVKCGEAIIVFVKHNVGIEEAKRFYKDNPCGFYCNSEDFERFYK